MELEIDIEIIKFQFDDATIVVDQLLHYLLFGLSASGVGVYKAMSKQFLTKHYHSISNLGLS